jgi:Flp pilus assembly protein TadG
MTHRPNGPRARLLNRFVRSDAGVVAPMIGLMLLVLIGCVGIAIDTGRGVLVKARLVDALDAAGLAVGARLSTSDFTADAKKFVEANFKSGYSGAKVTSVVATPNAEKTVVSLSATAEMPTAFMRLFGTEMVNVRATSEVTRESPGLELVIALDNTGSMAGDMGALRTAANSLVDIVFGNAATGKNLYVGLVPFAQAVNIGSTTAVHYGFSYAADHSSWMAPQPSSMNEYYPTYWGGCVMARSGDDDRNVELPTGAKKFEYYYFPKGTMSKAEYEAKLGPNYKCSSPLLPMTPTKQKVKDAITLMRSGGNTYLNLGAVWSWRMLDPSWRGFWKGDMASNALPLNYNTRNMSKAAVLMTDGKNEVSEEYSAYGKLSEGRLGTTDASAANAELNDRLVTVCGRMKAAGIRVYTVAFRNPPEALQTIMRNCASQADYFFPANDTVALNKSFKTIGDSLASLRVSK